MRMTRHPVRSPAIPTGRLSPHTIGAVIALGLFAGCAGPADVGGTNRTDPFTVTGWSAAMGGISSDPRFEYGPKWDAIKAFSRAWSPR